MGKIETSVDPKNAENWEELRRYTSKFIAEVKKTVNGFLSFQDNFRGIILETEFTAANADTALRHNLGYKPNYYLVLNRSASMVIYDGAADTTTEVIYLKSSAIGSANILVM